MATPPDAFRGSEACNARGVLLLPLHIQPHPPNARPSSRSTAFISRPLSGSLLFTPPSTASTAACIHRTMSSSNIHVVEHPLISHHLANLRLADTSPKEFRSLVKNISSVLCIEATRSLPVKGVQGQGPLATFQGEQLAPRIGLVPILRAGLGMTEACLELLPENTSVLHIGLFREKVSLQPVEYYNKLPVSPTVDQVIILDPLIATGGTAVACIQMILDWGIPVDKIKFLCVLASQKGLEHVTESVPGLEIWVGHVDPELSEKGLILPGLGDTGDRMFDTLT